MQDKCKQVRRLYRKFEDFEKRDSLISQVTEVFGSASYCQSLFTIGDYRDYE